MRPANAFVLRQSPGGIRALEVISLPNNVIVNGWSDARELISEKDYSKFREIISESCYPGEKSLRKSGYGASTMWRFLNEMRLGDWVVVPDRNGTFYLAEISGEPFYDDTQEAHKTDSCYRRQVKWLNDKKPIRRDYARSGLISRMKTQQTSAYAQDLIDEIVEALQLASKTEEVNPENLFEKELRQKMSQAVLKEIHSGYMDERRFERLVQTLLRAIGASRAEIVPRLHDKGVDILTEFPLGPMQIRVGVQVKWHQGQTTKEYIDQLAGGLEAENLTVGWLISSGNFAEDCQALSEKLFQEKGLQINLMDGEQIATTIIDNGLQTFLTKV
ncbi:MAG: restriction endonuclease [Nitrospira sp.]|nr:restriction endonuclease [Nitrospira sp.]